MTRLADFVGILDRERDDKFREHLFEDHNDTSSIVYEFPANDLLEYAMQHRAVCETCERYAETLEVAE